MQLRTLKRKFSWLLCESLKTDGPSMPASFEKTALCRGRPKSRSVHPAPTPTASAGWALWWLESEGSLCPQQINSSRSLRFISTMYFRSYLISFKRHWSDRITGNAGNKAFCKSAPPSTISRTQIQQPGCCITALQATSSYWLAEWSKHRKKYEDKKMGFHTCLLLECHFNSLNEILLT